LPSSEATRVFRSVIRRRSTASSASSRSARAAPSFRIARRRDRLRRMPIRRPATNAPAPMEICWRSGFNVTSGLTLRRPLPPPRPETANAPYTRSTREFTPRSHP